MYICMYIYIYIYMNYHVYICKYIHTCTLVNMYFSLSTHYMKEHSPFLSLVLRGKKQTSNTLSKACVIVNT